MKNITRRSFAGGVAALSALSFPAVRAQTGITPAEARAIAKEAYVYGFPVVDNYRIEHAYFVDRSNAEFKAPWNQITNIPRVFTPDDKAVQTPNSDTPYSWMGADLRAEPIVLTCRRWKRNAISASSSPTPIPSTSTTSAPARSETTAVPTWSVDPVGRVRLPRA